MPIQTTPHIPEANAILNEWCEKNEVSINQFANAIHCEYQHAWNMLRGDQPITLARILIFLGPKGPAPAISEAMKSQLDQLYQDKQLAA
jgi:plasmid maintenance system antidote protein VapI